MSPAPFRSPWFVSGALALALGLTCGCAGASRDPTHAAHAATPDESEATSCYRDFRAEGSPRADVGRLGKRCAGRLGMRRLAAHDLDEQDEADAVERLAFRTHAGRCYRFFAVGARGVEDLDLGLRTTDGELLAVDASPDRFPVVPPSAPLCTRSDTELLVEVSVAHGRGTAALEVWGEDW